ncbi:MAG: xylulokinase [Anaerocolumna sp.]
MSKYILAHDLGTSGNKATLFSEDGKLIKSSIYTYEGTYTNGVWAEQDAEDWWKAVCITSRNLLNTTKIDPKDIAGISFSGQMMGCLCVDKRGNPLRKSIIWADQRAQRQSTQIEESISQQDFYHITGHRNTASYGVQKLMWIHDNEPEIYEQTYKVLNAKDFIVLRLTGKFYTEYSDANSMACFDLLNLKWSDELISYADIDPDKLPEIKPSTFVAGGVIEKASKDTGLVVGTPVVLGCGDGVAANVGTGSIRVGKTYSCMGTSAWITTTTDKPVFDEKMRIVTWAHAIPGLYAPNGTMQTAGGAYNWLKSTICTKEIQDAEINGISPYIYMNEQIQQSPVGSNGIIFLPYLLGERAPRWNADAKGAFLGLKSENVRGDLLRSVLEGVTMNMSIIMDILRKYVNISEITVVGGGAKGSVWRQMMADIYNTRIVVPDILEEAGSMGAAVIAGVGVGLYKDFNAIDQFIHINTMHEPNIDAVKAYEPVKELFNECYFALEKVFPKMK